MNQVIDRRVVFASAANFRDLGGLPIADGEVKRGEIYRSATLARLSDDDLPSFESLGINTVFDLRTAAESSADPDRLPQGARYLPLDVLADGTAGVAHAVAQLRHNPESVNDLLAGSRVDDMLMQSYREFITIASAQNAYRAFFEEVASAGREGAALFHCTAGKDRTGVLAASMLLALGASDAEIVADYGRSGPNIEAIHERSRPVMGVLMAQLGIDLDAAARAAAGDKPFDEFAMAQMLDVVRKGYGDPLTPLRAAGLSDGLVAALREKAQAA